MQHMVRSVKEVAKFFSFVDNKSVYQCSFCIYTYKHSIFVVEYPSRITLIQGTRANNLVLRM